MNATIHSEISVKKHGGKIGDFYHLHDFMDCSKEVEATNKHRFLTHTMFFVKSAMIPIFGETISVTGKSKGVNMKDMLEQDHILADYGGKFIPTLRDFSDEIEDRPDDSQKLKDFYEHYRDFFKENQKIKELLMMPLHLAGNVKALFATHNSWFIGHILPKIFPHVEIPISDSPISCSDFFNRMNYAPWMQNGKGVPPSFKLIEEKREKNVRIITFEGIQK